MKKLYHQKLNSNNTTGYTGVRRADPDSDEWFKSVIGIQGKDYFLGYFTSAKAASRAYQKALKQYETKGIVPSKENRYPENW